MPPANLGHDAETAYGRGDFQTAYGLYLQLAKAKPEEESHRVRLAECCLALGRRDDALRILKHLAAGLMERGKVAMAISVNKRILEVDPKDLGVQKTLERLYSQVPQEDPREQTQWKRAREKARQQVQNVARQDLIQGEGSGLDLAGPDDHVTVSIQEMLGDAEEKMNDPFSKASGLDLDDSYDGKDRSVSGMDGYMNVSFSQKKGVTDLSLASAKQGGAYPVIPLFSDLPAPAFARVIAHFKRLTYPSKTVVIKQGDPGDSIYIVAAGGLSVDKKLAGKSVKVADLAPGDFFGEFAYFAKVPRDASVTASGVVELLELSRASVDQIVREFPSVAKAMHNFYKTRVLENLLQQSPLFASLGDADRALVLQHIQFRSVKAGETVVKEGDQPDGFYVIQHGSAVVRKNGVAKPLAVLKAGEFFGEYSMITGSPRTASILAQEACDLAVLDADGFRALLQGRPQIVDALRKIAKQRLTAAQPDSSMS